MHLHFQGIVRAADVDLFFGTERLYHDLHTYLGRSFSRRTFRIWGIAHDADVDLLAGLVKAKPGFLN